ncbi:MAG: hypothetical protein OXC82_03820 [Rhodobacteraceae bacterium]|nr:hypothetical protein [Paracoccaceae bacterium]MCY4249549.1 hypothetical protein [Paracoccaceae bacterium]
MAKFQPLTTAINENLFSGSFVVFEGFTHLIPYAAAHEAIRSGITDLTLARMTPDVIYDQMIGMGMVRKLIFSYAGNPGVGLLRRLRDAVENEWPRPLVIEEHSHAAMANSYEAAASNLPLAILRGYQGAGLKGMNANIKSIECPFTGETLAAVPALRPDVAVIHAQKADSKGNVLVEGIIGVQKQAVLSAKKAIVTVEEIVPELNTHPNACIIPSWAITSISVVPGGAHPSYTQGYYERDNSSYLEWDRISSDRNTFKDWMRKNVLEQGPEAFNERVEHLRD